MGVKFSAFEEVPPFERDGWQAYYSEYTCERMNNVQQLSHDEPIRRTKKKIEEYIAMRRKEFEEEMAKLEQMLRNV